MKAVFLVTHSYELNEGEEEIKILGVYLSKAEGQLAVRRIKRSEGFRDHPRGFHVDRFEIGKDQWSEGFSTYKYLLQKKKKIKRTPL